MNCAVSVNAVRCFMAGVVAGVLLLGVDVAAQAPDAKRAQLECERQARYVQVDAAMLREHAAAGAPARAQLAIATTVLGGACDGDWVLVQVPSYAGSGGWIRRTLLGPQPPTIEAILAEHDALPVAATARRNTLAQRALALAPFDERAHSLKIELLRQGGDATALATAEAELEALRHPVVMRDPGEPRMIFVHDGGILSPLAILDGDTLRELVDLPASGNSVLGDSTAWPAYWRPGRAYNFYSGGVATGFVRVVRKEEVSCESDVALVRAVPERADDLPFGIAANFVLRSSSAVVPPPDPGEIAFLAQAIRGELAKNGVPAPRITAALAAGATDGQGLQVAAASLRSGGTRLVVATLSSDFHDESPAHRDRQVVARAIVEIEPDGRRHVAYIEAREQGIGESMQSYRYLDAHDLDGDGNVELIFVTGYYESWSYGAWSRDDEGWKEVVGRFGGGC